MSIPERSNGTGKIYLGDKIVCDTPCCWSPDANTILYCPFLEDIQDKTGNYTPSYSKGSGSITTLNGVKCLDLKGWLSTGYVDNTWDQTISIWHYNPDPQTYTESVFSSNMSCVRSGRYLNVGYDTVQNNVTFSALYPSYASQDIQTHAQLGWHNYIMTYRKCYVDGVYIGTLTNGGPNNKTINLGGNADGGGCDRYVYSSRYFGETIIDGPERDQTKITNYVNCSKGRYGL